MNGLARSCAVKRDRLLLVLVFVFVFLPLSALSLGCGGSGGADGDTGKDGDTETDAEPDGTSDGDRDADADEAEYACEQMNGPDYWGCVPDGFQVPREGAPCPKAGIGYCTIASACMCEGYECRAIPDGHLQWQGFGVVDAGCGAFGTPPCTIYSFDNTQAADGDCDNDNHSDNIPPVCRAAVEPHGADIQSAIHAYVGQTLSFYGHISQDADSNNTFCAWDWQGVNAPAGSQAALQPLAPEGNDVSIMVDAAGTYRLRLRAKDCDEAWCVPPKEVVISVAEADGDTQPHTGPACDDVSMLSPSTDPQAVSAAIRACNEYSATYADPEIAEYHAMNGRTCQPVTVSFGEHGRAVVCEVFHRDGDLPMENPSWPGPGYGCVWGPNVGEVITGWYGGVGGYSGQENTCHGQWTEGTWAFVLDRQQRDPTPCSTIGDLWTCLHTHNHPYHCQPQFGWDLTWDGAACESRRMSSFTGDELEEARFIGCRTVHEFYFDREVERGCRPYTGPILNLATGECLGYDYRECAIPAGWRKAACRECSRPADGDGEAE